MRSERWRGLPIGIRAVTGCLASRRPAANDSRWCRNTGKKDGLLVGEVEVLPEGIHKPLPEEFQPLGQILAGVLDDLGKLYEGLDRRYDDAAWVSYRFAEILPLPPEHKQACLEMDDPIKRLESMRSVLESVRG